MDYKFAFSIKDGVWAKDIYGKEHEGMVVERWLQENPPYKEDKGLLERYNVLLYKFQTGSDVIECLREELRKIE